MTFLGWIYVIINMGLVSTHLFFPKGDVQAYSKLYDRNIIVMFKVKTDFQDDMIQAYRSEILRHLNFAKMKEGDKDPYQPLPDIVDFVLSQLGSLNTKFDHALTLVEQLQRDTIVTNPNDCKLEIGLPMNEDQHRLELIMIEENLKHHLELVSKIMKPKGGVKTPPETIVASAEFKRGLIFMGQFEQKLALLLNRVEEQLSNFITLIKDHELENLMINTLENFKCDVEVNMGDSHIYQVEKCLYDIIKRETSCSISRTSRGNREDLKSFAPLLFNSCGVDFEFVSKTLDSEYYRIGTKGLKIPLDKNNLCLKALTNKDRVAVMENCPKLTSFNSHEVTPYGIAFHTLSDHDKSQFPDLLTEKVTAPVFLALRGMHTYQDSKGNKIETIFNSAQDGVVTPDLKFEGHELCPKSDPVSWFSYAIASLPVFFIVMTQAGCVFCTYLGIKGCYRRLKAQYQDGTPRRPPRRVRFSPADEALRMIRFEES